MLPPSRPVSGAVCCIIFFVERMAKLSPYNASKGRTKHAHTGQALSQFVRARRLRHPREGRGENKGAAPELSVVEKPLLLLLNAKWLFSLPVNFGLRPR